MSFWLNQVNKVLNQLDDAAEEAPDVVTSAATRARQLLGPTNESEFGDTLSDDHQDFEDDGFYSDEELNDELRAMDDRSVATEEEQPSEAGKIEAEGSATVHDNTYRPNVLEQAEDSRFSHTSLDPEHPEMASKMDKSCETLADVLITDEISEGRPTSSTSSSPVLVDKMDYPSEIMDDNVADDKQSDQTTLSSSLTQAIHRPLESQRVSLQAPVSGAGKVSKDQKEYVGKMKTALVTAQSDVVKLQKQNNSLEKQLNILQVEMNAQLNELHQAGITMEQEREDFKAEREEIFEDHVMEIQLIKDEYEKKLRDQRDRYEQELEHIQSNLFREQETRKIEELNTISELDTAIEREQEAMNTIVNLQTEKSSLESALTQMESQQDALLQQVQALTDSSDSYSKALEAAETKLDASVVTHKRLLQQRQMREAELERTVAELGTALTLAQQDISNASAPSSNKSDNNDALEEASRLVSFYKEQYDGNVEELEKAKTQLSIATSQCDALQLELQDLAKEKMTEAEIVRKLMSDYDEKLQSLTIANNRLEATVRELTVLSGEEKEGKDRSLHSLGQSAPKSLDGDLSLRQITLELEQSKRRIASLSDQLLRQQGITEQFKSEVLALKGRLQAATARAESAEQQHQQLLLSEGESGTDNTFELELGSYTGARARRRIKGGKNRFNQLPVKTIRKAVGLRQTNHPGIQQQIAKTIDAMDGWMLETGGILGHEPLARLGFAVYLLVIHAWCFVIITFHTVEAERHDLRMIPLHGSKGNPGH